MGIERVGKDYFLDLILLSSHRNRTQSTFTSTAAPDESSKHVGLCKSLDMISNKEKL